MNGITLGYTSIGIRLAIRNEGKMVNAYLAKESTMQNAMLIGSIAVAMAEQQNFFDRWKALMSDALAYEVERMLGQRPEMPERPAPESERSGNA